MPARAATARGTPTWRLHTSRTASAAVSGKSMATQYGCVPDATALKRAASPSPFHAARASGYSRRFSHSSATSSQCVHSVGWLKRAASTGASASSAPPSTWCTARRDTVSTSRAPK